MKRSIGNKFQAVATQLPWPSNHGRKSEFDFSSMRSIGGLEENSPKARLDMSTFYISLPLKNVGFDGRGKILFS